MTLRVACPAGHPVILTADKLGTAVACPHCLIVFQVESATELRPHARKEDKPRRARDDEDEDDEEDEKPQRKAAKKPPPKAKARKAKEEDDEEDDEDEKPSKKKKASREEEDDDDDEEEEEEEEEEDEPIVWTPRKRQLNMCGIGLIVMMVAYCIMMGFSFFMMLVLDYYTFDVMNQVALVQKTEGIKFDDAWTWLFAYTAAPFLGLAQLVLMVGLVMSLLAVPAKVEGRGSLIGGIVLGALVFLAGILIIMAASGAITADPLRAERMIQLMGGGAALCFVLGTLSTMAYHGKLLHFLNLRMESSQPITNTLFYFLYFAGTLVLFVATPYICVYLFNFFGWGVILAIDAVFAVAIRQLIAQAKMFLLAKKAIDKYIREA